MRFAKTVLFAASLLLAAAPANAGGADRIVSIGGDVTEILFAIGAGGRVVAVDSTSRFPAAARTLPDVGYMRQLSPEPILALAPDHIVAIQDSGPPGAVDVLRQAGVKFTEIADTPTVDGALAKIERVAAAIGEAQAGAQLASETRRRVEAARARVPADGARPRTVFLLSVGSGALLAGGRETSADGIIALAGGENVAAAFQGYKPIDPEALTARDPEVVVVTQRTLAALGGVEAILAMPQLAGTTAAKTGRVVAFDGLMLLGFGPRLADAIEAMTAALHPDAAE